MVECPRVVASAAKEGKEREERGDSSTAASPRVGAAKEGEEGYRCVNRDAMLSIASSTSTPEQKMKEQMKEVEVMGWFAEKPDKTLQNDINKVCGVVIYYTYIRIYVYTDI